MTRLHRSPYLLAFVILIAITPSSAQWTQSPSITSSAVMGFGAFDTLLFAGTDGDGCYRSTNSGWTWTKMTSGLSTSNGYAFLRYGRYLLLGSMAGVHRSTDRGDTWSSVGLTTLGVRSFLLHRDTILAAGDGGIYISVDSGAAWTRTDLPGVTVGYNFDLLETGGVIFDASNGAGVFRSTDGGRTWSSSSTGLTNTIVTSLTVKGSTIYAGTGGGVFQSTDNGNTWSLFGSNLYSVKDLLVVEPHIFAATMYHGVIGTTEGNPNWIGYNTGFVYKPTMNALAFLNSRFLVGTYGTGVWWAPLGGMVAGTSPEGDGIPSGMHLSQNYPNPFNPLTRIEFEIQNSEFITLKVYDAIGREVATLLNETTPPGTYRFEFDGSRLASGVYHYVLRGGSKRLSRSMLLLR